MSDYSYNVNNPAFPTCLKKAITKPERHRTGKENVLNKVAITALVVGVLALLGVAVGFLAAHGLLPQHIASQVGFLSQHKWILLGAGAVSIGIGTLGKLYLCYQDKKFKAEANEFMTGPYRELSLRQLNEMFFALQEKAPEKTAFMSIHEGDEREIKYPDYDKGWIGKFDVFKVPKGLFMICTSNSKGYTTHFYKDRGSLKAAERTFSSNGYTQITKYAFGKTSLILAFIHTL